MLVYIHDGTKWNQKEQMFTVQENYQRRIQRNSLVRVTIGDTVIDI